MTASGKVLLLAGIALVSLQLAWSEGTAVTAQIQAADGHHMAGMPGAGNAVVWLTPAEGTTAPMAASTQHFRLLQKGKHFEPHLLVVPLGAKIDFPNHDPFFHNVFSLYEGKRFDLGLYESGSNRTVIFDRPGVSYIFCSIHPQMAAIVIALDTPYYATSSAAGRITIPNVPPGHYVLHVWHEGASLATLNQLSRRVEVTPGGLDLGVLPITLDDNLQLTHKNKYGRDYDEPNPASPAYQR